MATTAAEPTAAPQGTRFMVQWEEHPMHLTSRLGYLLEHQSLVDVTLMCNTHTLKVHRTVLAACSPYFESVLQRQLGNHPLIVLKDMKFCVLKSLIEFMYCGETSVTEENLNPLMEAAKFFEVKGLCTMSKEVLGGERPSPSKTTSTLPVNGTNTSLADIIPSNTYRGRGRRPGVGRGRRNLSTMLIPPPQGAPQAETAQIMLSLSGNNAGPTLQTTSRNVRISPNSRMGRTLQTTSSLLDSTKLMQNGTLTDLKALREQLNLEPRRRGRRRQNFGLGRGRIKDLVDGKFGIQNIKKELEEIHHKDGIVFKPLDSKVNLLNNNGNNDGKTPLLASLLSKSEALAKANVKTENETDDGHNSEQETVLYQFDGESSGETKYLEALKEAGLPTDVPVLIDNGDGNYVTLTEDVLMNVLGNNEEFQFQVTEATLEQGDISEGVVMQDGTIMMTGKNGKSEVNGPLLTVSKKPVTIKGKRGPKSKQFVTKDTHSPIKVVENDPSIDISPKTKTPSKKSVQELINEAVLESLKNGAANEAENDPDAVVLFEVTDNNKVCKYVVSSKEVNALKALNEQIKKQNSPGEKKSPLSPTVIDGNTNIAEIKLTVPKNSRKSIVSEVLARAHSLENQAKNNMLNERLQTSGLIKSEVNSPQMLDINIVTDVLNDSSQLLNLKPSRDNLENPNIMDLGDEGQMLDDDHTMVVLNDEDQIMQLNGQDEGININESENLIVVSESSQIMQHERVDLTEEPSEDSQLMQINESSQEGGDPEDVTGDISVEESDETITQASRDMPLLENESQLVELEFIDGSGKKIDGYKMEGAVLSEKEISELTRLSERGKDSDVIGLLNMVCEEAAAQDDISNEELNEISPLDDKIPTSKTFQESAIPVKTSVNQPEYSPSDTSKDFTSSRDHLILEEVQSQLGTRRLESSQMSLDGRECQELSVEQALQAMMGDENSAGVENQEYSEQVKSPINIKVTNSEDSVSQQLSSEPENPNTFINFVYESSQHAPEENVQVMPAFDNPPNTLQVTSPETHILPDMECTNVASEISEPINKICDSVEEQETAATTLVSPTKDVPFAVGLLPLKDALVQLQSITEHQPRKTRSSSTSKSEGIAAKRRCSVENSVDGPVKRRKSLEEANTPSHISEEECVTST